MTTDRVSDGDGAVDRKPYEPPALERHADWEIVTGNPPSGLT